MVLAESAIFTNAFLKLEISYPSTMTILHLALILNLSLDYFAVCDRVVVTGILGRS
ncbi:MAG: hypothetical protein WCQ26_12605 [Pseudanabaena sp. ELA748]